MEARVEATIRLDQPETYRRLETIARTFVDDPKSRGMTTDRTVNRILGIGPGFRIEVKERRPPSRLVLETNSGRIGFRLAAELRSAASETRGAFALRIWGRGPIGWLLLKLAERFMPETEAQVRQALEEMVRDLAVSVAEGTPSDFDAALTRPLATPAGDGPTGGAPGP